MIIRLDHVGVAVEDFSDVKAPLTALGLEMVHVSGVEAYGVACEFWRFPKAPDGALVEIVSPVATESAIDKHLRNSGPGLYHLAFEVDDLDAEVERLRQHGFTRVDRQSCSGAWPGMRVRFMYFPGPVDALIELISYGESGADGRPSPSPQNEQPGMRGGGRSQRPEPSARTTRGQGPESMAAGGGP